LEKLVFPAAAKVNLTLDVGGKRPDGYHEVLSVIQTIDLWDILYCEKVAQGITVSCSSPEVPSGPENLVYRALELLAARFSGGLRVEVRKQIPVAAGLGGGSSDAAAALQAASLLYSLELKKEDLLSYAARIGSDVPFFILGGTALARGRGEIVEPLPEIPQLWLVLVKPGFGVSTREVYSRFRLEEKKEKRTPALLAALEQRDRRSFLEALGNDLEGVVLSCYPEVAIWKKRLLDLGAEKALVSGSGPTVFGIFPGEKEAEKARKELSKEKGITVFLCKTVTRVEIEQKRKQLMAGSQKCEGRGGCSEEF
jgi:4-diphosphocytidyl-2-C-methyl-D-erythritol kinase